MADYDTGEYDDAVMAALTANAGVTAAAPYGVHWGVAPDGIDLPHIVVMVASDSDDPDIGTTGVLSVAYLVRVCAETRADAAAAQKAVNKVLHAKTLPVTGFIEMRRSPGAQRYADGDGFPNNAAYYRLMFSYG